MLCAMFGCAKQVTVKSSIRSRQTSISASKETKLEACLISSSEGDFWIFDSFFLSLRVFS